MRHRGLPQKCGPVWTFRPSALTQRVVERIEQQNPELSRSQIVERAVCLGFWVQTCDEMQALHQEEMEELKKLADAVAPRAAQELIIKNLSRTIS